MENQEGTLIQGKVFNEQFDTLLEKLSSDKYKDQGYSKTSTVTIPGPLFADFLNFVSSTKQILENIDKVVAIIDKNTSFVTEEGAKMTLRLMEAHANNVDHNWTTSNEELDKEDAVENVQEIKES
jgi:hypothetical protein